MKFSCASRETFPLINGPHLAPSQSNVAHRLGSGLLIAATLYICYFSNLSVVGFVGPDEPRYAWIARDMAGMGDWVTPRLFGRPWFEKPPLLYWGGALFFQLMPDRPETAARLPSAICALLATLALAWLAWRTYGEECARWLLVLLPTSVGMIGFSHACAADMPFAGMLTIGLACAAVILGLVPLKDATPVVPRTPWLALVLFGFFLGLAVLAKGPAALILTGGAVFFWALFTRRWRDAFRLLHPAGIAMFCLTALPWYILCARRNPDFFRVFIIEHNFRRYLTPEFQHMQPFWYYMPVVFIAFLPWVTSFVWSIWKGVRRRPFQPLTVLLVCWSAFCLVFFSISRSKLPGYVLPAVPAIGLLFARSVPSRGSFDAKYFRISAAVGSLLFLLCAFFFLALHELAENRSRLNGEAAKGYALLAFCFALANLLLALVRSDRPILRSLPGRLAPVPILVAAYFATFLVRSSFPHDPSSRTLAHEISRPSVEPSNIYVGPINRGRRYGLSFYLNREIPEWDPSHPTTGLLVVERQNCSELVPPPYLCSEAHGLESADAQLYWISLPNSFTGLGSGRQPK